MWLTPTKLTAHSNKKHRNAGVPSYFLAGVFRSAKDYVTLLLITNYCFLLCWHVCSIQFTYVRYSVKIHPRKKGMLCCMS